MIKRVAVVIVLLSVCMSQVPAAARPPDAALKARVRSIVKAVENISKRSGTLDEFGQRTVGQGKAVLSIGPGAVYALSNCLSAETDWKVRFWIADMMGYLENPDAVRPLTRLRDDSSQDKRVRKQAEESIKRLKSPIERDVQ